MSAAPAVAAPGAAGGLEVQVVPLSVFRPDPENANLGTERGGEMLGESLAKHRAGRSILVDRGRVAIAGSKTLRRALDAGFTEAILVPSDGRRLVVVQRTDLEQGSAAAAELALADNRVAEVDLAWDPVVLERLSGRGVKLDGLWTRDELLALLAPDGPAEGQTDPDAVPAMRPTDIQLGDLFELGSHRLVCGDATDPEVLARLFAGAKPALMVTDPPYGVAYDPAWRAAAGVNKSKQKMGQVLNDTQADWTEVWQLFPGWIAYVWHAGLKASTVQGSLERAGFSLRAQIIWAKDRMALSRGDYHWQHEPAWYGVREGKPGERTGDRSQATLWRIATPDVWLGTDGQPIPETTTLWEIPAREDAGHGHGTQKPVECMARPMRNHHAEEVFDPFVGSGTTIIAGSMWGRRVFACELKPEYCQVSIDRWEAFSGQKAVKVA